MGSGSSRKASSSYKLQVDPASTASPSKPSPQLDPPPSPSPTPTVAQLKARLKEMGWKLPPDVVEKSELLALVQEAEQQKAVKAKDAAHRKPKEINLTPPLSPAACAATGESPANRSVAELKKKLKELGLKVPGDIIEKNELRALVEEAERQASLSETSATTPKAPVKPTAPVRIGSRLRDLGVEAPDSIADETELRTVLKAAEQKQRTVELEALQGSTDVKLTCTRGVQGIARIEVQSSPEPRTEMHEPASLSDGLQFDRQHWQRGDNLGHGSFGSVFKALNSKTGGIIAVKEVFIDVSRKTDEKLKISLENEIDLMRSLRHPNIVAYYGCDWADDHLHMYLEYMAGGSLSQVLNQFGPLDENLIVDYTRQLLSGLEYLHTQSPYIVHRDIKGANVLVGIDSTVKLADFGCSKRAKETTSLTIEGSIPWMAPEVLTHSRFGRAGDIWSFGCLLIEMAAADAPWGHFDNLMAAILKIGMSGELPPVPETLSSKCRSFIRRCTQLDPGNRLSASELLNEDFLSTDLARVNSTEKTLIEPAEEELPKGWEKHWDPGYSAWYYWHSTSGRSLWEPPSSLLEEANSEVSEALGHEGEADFSKTLT